MRNNLQIGLSMLVGRIVEVESTGDGLSWQNAFETNGPDAVGVSFFGSFLCLNLGSVVFSANAKEAVTAIAARLVQVLSFVFVLE